MRIFVFLFIFALMGISFSANASASRYLDGQYITNGSYTLTIPGITDTLLTLTGSGTLTNKTMSGASNTFSNIPVGAIGGGSVLSGTNTGDVTLGTASGLSLSGQQLSLGVASSGVTGALSGSDWTTFNGKQNALGYTPLNPSSFSAKGDILVGTGSGTFSAVSTGGAGNNGQILTADSSETNGLKWAAAPSVGPVLNGTSVAPQSVTAVGGITLTGISYNNIAFIVGNGGAVTVSATPSVTACTADGQILKLIGTSATNTVTLQDRSNLASSGLSLNGNWIAEKDSTITLHCDITQGLWVEDSRR